MILAVLNGEKTNLERLINLHINQYEYLQHNYALLLTIPGVGPVVSRYMLIVIGSRTFKSASQCAAYIGLVPIQNESGSSLRGEVDSLKQEIPSSELSSIWLLFRHYSIILILKLKFRGSFIA